MAYNESCKKINVSYSGTKESFEALLEVMGFIITYDTPELIIAHDRNDFLNSLDFSRENGRDRIVGYLNNELLYQFVFSIR